MEDPRYKVAGIEVEDPRCEGLQCGMEIVMEDLRCERLLDRAARQIEDPHCMRANVVVEDPRCQWLHLTW